MQTLDSSSPQDTNPSPAWDWRGYSIHTVHSAIQHPHQPPLLLVHGFGASTDHWRKTIAELQYDVEIWAVDLLGFGRSEKPNLDYSATLWRGQLVDFIREQIGRPAILVGNSIGGYISLVTATSYPDWVAGVVLLNSAGTFKTPITGPTSVVQTLLRQTLGWTLRQTLTHAVIFNYLKRRSTIRKTLRQVYTNAEAVTKDLVEAIYEPACDPGAFQVFSNLFKRPPQGQSLDELLPRLHCPLLLLWGELDPWIKARDRSQLFRQYYPALTEHFLQAGHCPHDDAPEEVNRLLREWIVSTF